MRKARGLASGLVKDTHNLILKFREFQRQHNAPWMQDQIEAGREHFDMTPQHLAHAPLDAIAFMRFAEYLACGEPHTRA